MNKKANLARGMKGVFSAPSAEEPIEKLAQEAGKMLRRRKQDNRPLTEKGCKLGETRATILITKELLEKLKNLSYWERLPLKEVISAALEAHIDKYEKKNGSIKQRKK